MLKEFKEFINRGNVIELAVGVVIGAAFARIVSALVDDIISPILGLMIGQTDFSQLKLTLKEGYSAGDKVVPPVTMNIGSFLEATLDFILIALIIFMLVKAYNRSRRPAPVVVPPPPVSSKEEILLTEIRDILKTRNV